VPPFAFHAINRHAGGVLAALLAHSTHDVRTRHRVLQIEEAAVDPDHPSRGFRGTYSRHESDTSRSKDIARFLTQICIGYTAEGDVVPRFAWCPRKFYTSFCSR
jgi:hypothetical protein